MSKKIVSPLTLDYQNRFMKILHTKVDFGAFQKDYYVVNLGPRAGIIALQDQCVLLTQQYRFLIDGFTWEIPGGRVDKGETPEFAAMRECVEETGVECRHLRKLVEYYPGLDNFDNRTTVFVSEDTRVIKEFKADAAEVVEIRWAPIDEAFKMITSGEILDALTVTALSSYIAVESRKQA